MEMNNNFRIADLFLIYLPLLSAKQALYGNQYYLLDLSLSEIAEENNISRAAVLDCLKSLEKNLNEYEEKLHLLEKKTKIKEILNDHNVENDEKLQKLEELL